jgi:prophage regulatory protein
MKYLTYQDLRERGVPYSPTHLWRLVKAGKFPKPIKLYPGPGARNLWDESEVVANEKERRAARDREET